MNIKVNIKIGCMLFLEKSNFEINKVAAKEIDNAEDSLFNVDMIRTTIKAKNNPSFLLSKYFIIR